MIKKLLAISLLMLYASPVMAVGDMVFLSRAVAKDYVPATISVREGGYSGADYNLYICDNTGAKLVNGISATGPCHASVGTQTLAFTNCTALTPGATYYVVWNLPTSDYVQACVSGDTYNILSNTSGTFASPPDIQPGSDSEPGVGKKAFDFQVKNAAGQVLLSFGDMTTTTNGGYQKTYEATYKKLGSVCNTL